MKTIIFATATILYCSAAFAACPAPTAPAALERALSTICSPGGRYSIGDQGGADVQKAAATCASLRQFKEKLERDAKACEQTVPETDKKILDEATKAISK